MPYIDYVENVFSRNPLFVVGSGSSCGGGISGMGALSEYLIENLNSQHFNEEELEKWTIFKQKIREGRGLEQVLQDLGDVSKELTNAIVYETWKCIASDEISPMVKMLSGDDVIGFNRLFSKYADTTVDCINVITTNYDHLIEASAAISGWEIWDGFGNGVLSKPIESKIFNKRMRTLVGYHPRKSPMYENIKHLKIYKPHGSLSWFKKADSTFFKVPGASVSYFELMKGSEILPVIVTPGIGKYLETHYEPYTNVMAEMKESIHSAKTMVIIGFGFNDEHIQASFQSVLRNSHVPKVIATRELSSNFHDMVQKNEINNFVAIEKHGDGSRVLSDKLPDVYPKVYIDEKFESWSLKGLLNIIWGEQ